MNNLRVLACILLATMLPGCAALDPVQLEPEFTPPPAAAPVWTQLEQATPDEWLYLLNDGSTALDWRLRAIDSATDSIDVQTFLWEFDTTGSLVLDRLVRAAERGVTIRVLVDDTFLPGQDSLLDALHEHGNIEYRVFNPFKRRANSVLKREILNLAEFHRLDHRMHNKSMIVDNRVAIVGGRNLADEYFGLDAQANFRDMELLVGGRLVPRLANVFDGYWNNQWSFPIELLADAPASTAALERARRVLSGENGYSPREESAASREAAWAELAKSVVDGRAAIYADKPPAGNPDDAASAPEQVANEIVRLLDDAQQEILIISAYLIPTVELEDAVRRAAARGVRVRILTNSIRSNNHLAAHSAYRKHIGQLVSHGAEVHEIRIDAEDRHLYMLTPVEEKELALHAKVLVIDDDQVFIGSANLDPRSMRINTEMGLLVESTVLNAQVRAAVARDFDPRNAWRLEIADNGRIYWVSAGQRLDSQPAESFMQRIEDWFLAHLPIENEM